MDGLSKRNLPNTALLAHSLGPKKFIEEWDIREALIGAGPIVIDKQTSRLFLTNISMLDVLDQIKNGKEVDLSILANRGKEIGEESKK